MTSSPNGTLNNRQATSHNNFYHIECIDFISLDPTKAHLPFVILPSLELHSFTPHTNFYEGKSICNRYRLWLALEFFYRQTITNLRTRFFSLEFYLFISFLVCGHPLYGAIREVFPRILLFFHLLEHSC